MSLEQEFIGVSQGRNAHSEWLAFKESSSTEQEIFFKRMSLDNQELMRQLEGMTNLAIQAQQIAKVATAKNMGMPDEMIQKYLGGQGDTTV